MRYLAKPGSLLSGSLLAVATLLNMGGCLNNSPLAPEEESLSSQGKLQFLKIGDGNPSLKKVIQVSQLITKENGGELILKHEINRGDESVEVELILKVLPRTVSGDTEFTLSLDDQYLITNVDFTFGPHGIIFSKPALLSVEAEGLDLSNIHSDKIDLYYDNPDTGQWEKMKCKEIEVDLEDGEIEVEEGEIPHFSRYAIGWGE